MRIISTIDKNVIPEKESSLIVNETRRVLAGNVYSVVVNFYDTFDNFLFQEKYDNYSFRFSYDSVDDYLNSVKERIRLRGLQEDGIYKVVYHFVRDIFQSIRDEYPDNKFILTEISPDRTEIRLNPKANDEEFIEAFNNFKNGLEIQEIPLAQRVEVFFTEAVDFYVNNLYDDDTIDKIVRQMGIVRPDGVTVSYNSFITTFFPSVNAIELEQTIKQILLDDYIATKEYVINQVKSTVINNETVNNLVNLYKNNPIPPILSQLEGTLTALIRETFVEAIIPNIKNALLYETYDSVRITNLLFPYEEPEIVGSTGGSTIELPPGIFQNDGICRTLRIRGSETSGPFGANRQEFTNYVLYTPCREGSPNQEFFRGQVVLRAEATGNESVDFCSRAIIYTSFETLDYGYPVSVISNTECTITSQAPDPQVPPEQLVITTFRITGDGYPINIDYIDNTNRQRTFTKRQELIVVNQTFNIEHLDGSLELVSGEFVVVNTTATDPPRDKRFFGYPQEPPTEPQYTPQQLAALWTIESEVDGSDVDVRIKYTNNGQIPFDVVAPLLPNSMDGYLLYDDTSMDLVSVESGFIGGSGTTTGTATIGTTGMIAYNENPGGAPRYIDTLRQVLFAWATTSGVPDNTTIITFKFNNYTASNEIELREFRFGLYGDITQTSYSTSTKTHTIS
jgi:hypothetical protein